MKRVKFAASVIFLIMLLCVGAIVKCTLFNDDVVSVLGKQYSTSVISVYPRGTIYDRNGIAFTNRNDGEYRFFSVSDKKGGVASYVCGELITDKDSTTSDACFGANGLQRAYNSVLSGGSPINVKASVDASGNILKEYGYTVVNDHPNEGGIIETTLDYNIQKSFEECLASLAEEKEYSGLCAVMTDIESGEIVAMASYGGYLNKTVLSYQPGSVMKIITAAVALDEGLITKDSLYICSGSVAVGDRTRYCASNAVHGEITISEAFAYSCNCCFYELAKALTYTDENGSMRSKVLDKAKEWGFAEYGEIPQERFELEYDSHYSFVESDIYNDMDIFNSALGEGKIQASPYLINRFTAAIANGGEINGTYITAKVTDAAGNMLTSGNKEKFDLNLKDETVAALNEMMRLTGKIGTGKKNTLGDKGGMAGKTGTAENAQGEKAHSWFTGYFPADEPKYALTVLIENGGSAPSNAVYVFDRLVNSFYELNL